MRPLPMTRPVSIGPRSKGAGTAYPVKIASAYPPTFLMISALLALVPYVAALLIWVAVTMPAYVAVIWGIVGRPEAALAALAFPATLWNLWGGQTGFLTASLVGATLLFAESRPVLAGACLGLLTVKPHLGLLFPIVLIATGRWRVVGAATVAALSLAAVSWLAFGTATGVAFLGAVGDLSAMRAFSTGYAVAGKLQSVYGFVRIAGGSDLLAWSLHGIVGVVTIVGVCWLWRRDVRYDLKEPRSRRGRCWFRPTSSSMTWSSSALPSPI